MEFNGKKSVFGLMEQEKSEEMSPQRNSNAMSPWSLSPLQTPSPSILYHCIASLHRHDGTIHSLALANGVVFSGSDSPRIRAWRQQDCLERGHIKASCGQVRSIVAFGNTLFTSHKDHKIRMWNFSVLDSFKSTKVSTLPKQSSFRILSRAGRRSQLHQDSVSCMAYYHAEGLLYTGSFDRSIKAWRVSARHCVDSFVAHEDNVNAIAVSQDDGCVFSCSSDGSVKIWRRVYRENSHTLTMTLKFQASPVNALALQASFLYSGSSDGTINFWERERKVRSRYSHGGFLQGHRFAVLCLVAVETLVFSGSEDTSIRVWRRAEGGCFHECLAVLEGHRGPVRCLAACLDVDKLVMGFLLYSASLDHTFKVWRVKVMPENNSCSEISSSDSKIVTDYEISPVLSPSWVERKIGTTYFQ